MSPNGDVAGNAGVFVVIPPATATTNASFVATGFKLVVCGDALSSSLVIPFGSVLGGGMTQINKSISERKSLMDYVNQFPRLAATKANIVIDDDDD